jgi:CheY-like chemotaxis protein
VTEAAGRRLLLVEDDRDIARFMEMALEELPLEIVHVASLAAARRQLAAERFDIVITDLMLPDGSSESLLAEGHALRPDAPPWLVFSAGLNPVREAQLRRLGASRLLHKPLPLGLLLETVSDCLALGPPPPAASADAEGVEAAIGAHFGGDRSLFEAFRAGCLDRFADDRRQGGLACDRRDAVGLRHLTHSLKSVLQLIGRPALASEAHALEEACARGPGEADWPALVEAWRRLAGGLAALD